MQMCTYKRRAVLDGSNARNAMMKQLVIGLVTLPQCDSHANHAESVSTGTSSFSLTETNRVTIARHLGASKALLMRWEIQINVSSSLLIIHFILSLNTTEQNS